MSYPFQLDFQGHKQLPFYRVTPRKQWKIVTLLPQT